MTYVENLASVAAGSADQTLDWVVAAGLYSDYRGMPGNSICNVYKSSTYIRPSRETKRYPRPRPLGRLEADEADGCGIAENWGTAAGDPLRGPGNRRGAGGRELGGCVAVR